ncbi:MAG: hypothetical protein ACC631_04115, partial [Halocynthiibacter sp.]
VRTWLRPTPLAARRSRSLNKNVYVLSCFLALYVTFRCVPEILFAVRVAPVCLLLSAMALPLWGVVVTATALTRYSHYYSRSKRRTHGFWRNRARRAAF